MAAASSTRAAGPQGPRRRRADGAGTKAKIAASPITIVVNGPGGPRCTVEASTGWTILQVHKAILKKLSVPVDWQTLLHGTEILAWEAVLSRLVADGSATLHLTLVVQEEEDTCSDEDIVEMRAEAAREDPLFCAVVRRFIDNAVFHGEVEAVDVGVTSGHRFYRIRYFDGDLEHMTAGQVRRYRV